MEQEKMIRELSSKTSDARTTLQLAMSQPDALSLKVIRESSDTVTANRARLRLVATLKRAGNHRKLIAQIKGCKAHASGASCGHPLCPSCLRRMERWLLWTAPVAMRKAARRVDEKWRAGWDDFALLTLTSPLRLRSSKADVAPEELRQIMRGFHATLDASGINVAMGFIEFVGIRDAASAWELEFCAKLRVLVLAIETSPVDARKSIGRHEKVTGRRSRPATVKRLRGSEIKQLLRPGLTEESVWPGRRKGNGRLGRQVYQRRRLAAEDIGLLTAACSEIDVTDRLFLHGVRVATNRCERIVVRAKRNAVIATKAVKAAFDAYFADFDGAMADSW